jgi:hypothetical protein
MANQDQLEILKQGVKVWNRWREENPREDIDLIEADLQRENLTRANLSFADLNKADLMWADLSGAYLYKSTFLEANLYQGNLTKADLRGADLWGANLGRAILAETDLEGANLSGARFAKTILGSVDLSVIKGIEEILHFSPSVIGADTLMLSKGKIPELFLRGCGLSDLQIEFAKLVVQGLDSEQVTDITYKIHQLYIKGGIEYYTCFISYSNKDEKFAKKLHDDLQNNGVRCWFAPEDMKIGDQIRPTIDRQIRLRDKLLVILSENSVKSEWVGDEVEAALEEESTLGRLVLFPIRLDDAVMDTRDDWAAKVKRRRHIGDFSNWKDEGSYRRAFERLLRDLKAGSA